MDGNNEDLQLETAMYIAGGKNDISLDELLSYAQNRVVLEVLSDGPATFNPEMDILMLLRWTLARHGSKDRVYRRTGQARKITDALLRMAGTRAASGEGLATAVEKVMTDVVADGFDPTDPESMDAWLDLAIDRKEEPRH